MCASDGAAQIWAAPLSLRVESRPGGVTFGPDGNRGKLLSSGIQPDPRRVPSDERDCGCLCPARLVTTSGSGEAVGAPCGCPCVTTYERFTQVRRTRHSAKRFTNLPAGKAVITRALHTRACRRMARRCGVLRCVRRQLSQNVTSSVKPFVERPAATRKLSGMPQRPNQRHGHRRLPFQIDLLIALHTGLHFVPARQLCTLREDMPYGGGSKERLWLGPLRVPAK